MDISGIFPFSGAAGQDFMMTGLEYFLSGLIIIGALIIILSLVPASRLITQLSPSRIRRNWQVLRVLIIVFLFGYLCYVAVNWRGNLENYPSMSHYVVPVS